MTIKCEVCYILAGQCKNGIWHAKLLRKSSGSATSVEFDWQYVMDREERKEDIVGFFHTHPDGMPDPSTRDNKTMAAWTNCFGKPLICVIESSKMINAWIYNLNEEISQPVEQVERFRGGYLIAVAR